MRKALTAIGIVILIAILAWLLFMADDNGQNNNQNTNNTDNTSDIEIEAEFENKIVYTTDTSQDDTAYQQDCQAKGGKFDECGTPCPPDAEICATVCAYTCDLGDQDTTIEGWTTYTSSQGTYSIQYPDDMKVDQSDSMVNFSLFGPTQKEGTEFYDGISFSLRIEESVADQSLEEYTQSKSEENSDLTEILSGPSQITLAGQTAYAYTAQSLGIFRHIFLNLEGEKVLHIYYTNPDPTEQGFQEITEEMLTSLEI